MHVKIPYKEEILLYMNNLWDQSYARPFLWHASQARVTSQNQIVVGVFEKINKISKPLTKLEGTEDSNP